MKDFFNKEPDLVIEKDGATYNCWLDISKVSFPGKNGPVRLPINRINHAMAHKAWVIQKVITGIKNIDEITDDSSNHPVAVFIDESTDADDITVILYPDGSKKSDFSPLEIPFYSYLFEL